MLLMSATIWFLYSANEDKAEKIGTYETTIQNYQRADELRKIVNDIGVLHRQELEKVNARHAKEQGHAQAQINMAQLDASKRAKADPTKFGDDLSVAIARIMCRMGESDGGAREQCDSAPAEAFTSQFALALTVTPELAADWSYRCELWRDYKSIKDPTEREAFKELFKVTPDDADFCEWSITGFTEVGVGIVKGWLVSVEGKDREKSAWIDNTIRHVDAVNNAKIPDLKESK